MRASQPNVVAWLRHPAALSGLTGLLAFVFAAVAAPPPPLVAVVLSLPFFYYLAESRWKDCINWVIATIPFQYYFDIGGLSLTHSELYLFSFAGAYTLSRIVKDASFLLPAALTVPALYAASEFTVLATGHADLVKHALRTVAAVFFCPRPRGNAIPCPN